MVAVRWRERWRSVPNLSLAVPNPKVVLRALVPHQKSTILKLGPPPPDEHTSEGGRDDRGVPYHAEPTLSSAQVLKMMERGDDTASFDPYDVEFVEHLSTG